MKFQSFVLPDIKDWAYAGCKDKQTVWRPGKVHALDPIINLFINVYWKSTNEKEPYSIFRQLFM